MPTHNAEIRMLWGTPCAMGLPRATELRTRTTDCYDAGRRIGRVLLRGVFRGTGYSLQRCSGVRGLVNIGSEA